VKMLWLVRFVIKILTIYSILVHVCMH